MKKTIYIVCKDTECCDLMIGENIAAFLRKEDAEELIRKEKAKRNYPLAFWIEELPLN